DAAGFFDDTNQYSVVKNGSSLVFGGATESASFTSVTATDTGISAKTEPVIPDVTKNDVTVFVDGSMVDPSKYAVDQSEDGTVNVTFEGGYSPDPESITGIQINKNGYRVNDGKVMPASPATMSYQLDFANKSVIYDESKYEVSSDPDFGSIIGSEVPGSMTPGGTYYIRVKAAGGLPASFPTEFVFSGVTFNLNKGTGADDPDCVIDPATGMAEPGKMASPLTGYTVERPGYAFAGFYGDSAGLSTAGVVQYYDANLNGVHVWDLGEGATLYAEWTLDVPAYQKKTIDEIERAAAEKFAAIEGNQSLTDEQKDVLVKQLQDAKQAAIDGVNAVDPADPEAAKQDIDDYAAAFDKHVGLLDSQIEAIDQVNEKAAALIEKINAKEGLSPEKKEALIARVNAAREAATDAILSVTDPAKAGDVTAALDAFNAELAAIEKELDGGDPEPAPVDPESDDGDALANTADATDAAPWTVALLASASAVAALSVLRRRATR
ncbi:MAG: DUF1542 domain-containing protein, partial [Oscillospiraceae bacterium]|nr:DUF1542 domain-containing protein [Oscillospiraceae bacterium]